MKPEQGKQTHPQDPGSSTKTDNRIYNEEITQKKKRKENRNPLIHTNITHKEYNMAKWPPPCHAIQTEEERCVWKMSVCRLSHE